MPSLSLPTALQVLLALGLLNVWLLRATSATGFRGGDSVTLRGEFEVYGLPAWSFYFVGLLKLGAALLLLVGLWVPSLVLPAAAVVEVLMIGAVVMHLKVEDPFAKSVPALVMLALSSALIGFNL